MRGGGGDLRPVQEETRQAPVQALQFVHASVGDASVTQAEPHQGGEFRYEGHLRVVHQCVVE